MSDEPRRWKPEFGRSPQRSRQWTLLGPALVALGIVAVMYGVAQRGARPAGELVVYTSQDQVYAEPLLRAFEQESGLRVKAVYDSEAVKTVGLANRLLAEKAHPQADVFWNNEVLRTRQLQAAGVLASGPPPVALGYRSRRLVLNTNLVSVADAPRSLAALTNGVWSGRAALGYPLFGTTATHFHVLRQAWGEEAWRAWCRALQANRPFIVDGNSVVVRLVGRGQAAVGLTDSDDIAAGQREGYPIVALPLAEDSLLIPNTVALVEGALHPTAGRALLEYLQRPEVLRRLVAVNALEGASAAEVQGATLQADWPTLLRDLEATTAFLKEVFLR